MLASRKTARTGGPYHPTDVVLLGLHFYLHAYNHNGYYHNLVETIIAVGVANTPITSVGEYVIHSGLYTKANL